MQTTTQTIDQNDLSFSLSSKQRERSHLQELQKIFNYNILQFCPIIFSSQN